jgi:hypothetical protein
MFHQPFQRPLPMSSRREWLRNSLLGAAATLVSGRDLFAASGAAAAPVVTVYKDPGCECCAKWVKHIAASGFVVSVRDVSNMDEIKRTMKVPSALESCHTAVVGRYVIEGHVPGDVIKKLLAEKSPVMGLAVPGMVTGSPGMEGGTAEHYNIVAFEQSGKTRVYASR